MSTLSSDSASQDSLLEDSLSAPGPASEPSVETPDSLDSMDVHEAFLGSLGPHAPQKLLTPDKPADSGYETENLESPEWTLHPAPEGAAAPDTASAGEDTPTGLPPKPVIVISDATDSHRGTEVTSQTAAPASQGSHRDSAYFSDNDSEPDRRSEGALGTSVSALGADQPLPEPGVPLQSPSPLDSCLDSSSSPPDPSCPPAPQKSRHLESREPTEPAPLDPPTHTLPPDDEAGSPSSLQNSELSSGDDLEAPEEPPCTLASTGTNTDELLALTHAPLRCGGPAAPTPEKALCGHSEGPKLKEPDVEGKYLGKLGVSGMLDLAEDGMDADEEDENSEDSDEDLRAFTLHSLSSESEDEAEHPVPVVLSREDGRHLRSLLKPVDPLPGCRRERKAVTFFDDVTVYLFDQETPTKELGHGGGAARSPERSSPAPAAGSPHLSRGLNSESSTDEEGGGFEWDDDFSPDPFLSRTTSHLLSSKPALQTSKYFSPPPPRSAEPSWPHAAPYSRFSITPASIASFSLTHLTDSDMEQGGSSEDGEKD